MSSNNPSLNHRANPQQALSLDRPFRRRAQCRYLLHLPSACQPQGHPWPLILYLHGAGERGDDLEMVKKHGPPKLIAAGRDLPFIVLSPLCPKDQTWHPHLLTELLDEVQEHHNIDKDRVYLTGLSMGGFGTWALGIDTPERFAAIAPICGGGAPYIAYRLRRVPVWAFHGDQDEVVPPYESQRMVEAVQQAGGNARLTVYPGVGHDAWTRTYEGHELYDWLLSHKRAARAAGGT
ncbi:MAG TPA: prolyl oligopeptidase family serine peptidase [Phycisphaerae bacterium]|nr:prolyl oligopeptidase family serine peptidase [Phycisphaerae bacterium]HRY71058.1 prolyl oligopeptidase family serine peptidase [Phycisphaerae bacterium]HSA29148.1 prolyl oligopeptidase family serine peptidase [Phycisphaerae bacterium]